jgi:F0F1-type ATP synthase assembly protein I
MENNNKENGFSYNYSAKEQAEIKNIREKYRQKTEEEDKMARLRRLDASVTQTAEAVSLVFGIVGTLILGFGMSLVMSDLAAKMNLGAIAATVIGVISGIIGGILAGFAYPVYNYIVREKRKKIAPEIIRLTDELMK